MGQAEQGSYCPATVLKQSTSRRTTVTKRQDAERLIARIARELLGPRDATHKKEHSVSIETLLNCIEDTFVVEVPKGARRQKRLEMLRKNVIIAGEDLDSVLQSGIERAINRGAVELSHSNGNRTGNNRLITVLSVRWHFDNAVQCFCRAPLHQHRTVL